MVLNGNLKPFTARLEGQRMLCGGLLKDKLWKMLFEKLNNVTKLL